MKAAPDVVDIQVICGARAGTAAAMRRNSSITGCIRGEWKACETVSNCDPTPRAAKWDAIAVTASRSPEMTVFCGAFTAAMAMLSALPIDAATVL